MATAQELLDRAEALAQDAQVEAQRLIAERDQLTQRIRELESIARRFARAAPKMAGRPRKQDGRSKEERITPRRLARTADFILDHFREGEFVPRDLAETMGMKVSSVYPTLNTLRDMGFLRKAGSRKVNGAPMPSTFYAVMDVEVIDAIKKEEAAANGAS